MSSLDELGYRDRLGRSPIRLRLGTRLRKLILLFHIGSAGAWLGIDVAMAAVIFTGLSTDDPQRAAVAFRALEIFTIIPLLTVGVICLITGLFLGWGSKWGVLRYKWVLVKLILNLVLTLLVLVALRSGVQDAAIYGSELAAGVETSVDPSDLIYPPIVSTSSLTFAMILAVFKPWGRVRNRSRRGDGAVNR